jgi:hypothetical protein
VRCKQKLRGIIEHFLCLPGFLSLSGNLPARAPSADKLASSAISARIPFATLATEKTMAEFRVSKQQIQGNRFLFAIWERVDGSVSESGFGTFRPYNGCWYGLVGSKPPADRALGWNAEDQQGRVLELLRRLCPELQQAKIVNVDDCQVEALL